MTPTPIILHVDFTLADLRELNRQHQRRNLRSAWWLFFGMAVAIILFFVLISALSPPSTIATTAPATTATRASSTLLFGICFPLVPWFFFLGVVYVLLRIYNRRTLRRAFDQRN